MLIRNIRFANSQLIVSGKKITFNNDGTADITDPDLFEALLKIKGFTDASDPLKPEKMINLKNVKLISIDELDKITNDTPEEAEPEEKLEEKSSEDSTPKPRSKSKKKGR